MKNTRFTRLKLKVKLFVWRVRGLSVNQCFPSSINYIFLYTILRMNKWIRINGNESVKIELIRTIKYKYKNITFKNNSCTLKILNFFIFEVLNNYLEFRRLTKIMNLNTFVTKSNRSFYFVELFLLENYINYS